jgi:hypothetical protein
MSAFCGITLLIQKEFISFVEPSWLHLITHHNVVFVADHCRCNRSGGAMGIGSSKKKKAPSGTTVLPVAKIVLVGDSGMYQMVLTVSADHSFTRLVGEIGVGRTSILTALAGQGPCDKGYIMQDPILAQTIVVRS